MAIVNGLVTAAELKSWSGIPDAADDAHVERAIESASHWIGARCGGRQFWLDVDATRVFDVMWSTATLDTGDLTSVTTLKTDDDRDGTFETTWDAADYQLVPVTPQDGHPYELIQAVGTKRFPYVVQGGRSGLVQVVGTFGWPAVPAPVKQACLIKAAEYFRRRYTPDGLADAAAPAGAGEFGFVSREDRDVLELLEDYRDVSQLIGFA